MNITITAKNADGLDKFEPVEGSWKTEGSSFDDGNTELDVVESIINWADAPYKMTVQVFDESGSPITSDLPDHGTFIAIRA